MFSFLKNGENKDSKGYLWILLLIAAVGILLILVGGSSEKQTKKEAETDYRTDQDELLIYQDYLENRIRALCESVGGVGNVRVVVTLSGSFESVYATEWKDGNEEYVILGSGSSATALYLTRSAPEIAGIGIVCDGGSIDRVRYELTSLLAATFDVSTHRIYITAAK